MGRAADLAVDVVCGLVFHALKKASHGAPQDAAPGHQNAPQPRGGGYHGSRTASRQGAFTTARRSAAGSRPAGEGSPPRSRPSASATAVDAAAHAALLETLTTGMAKMAYEIML